SGSTVFDYRNYHGVPHSRQRAEICFDVTKLDAISAELDLLIQAAFEKKQTITETPHVAGTIGTLTTILKKSVCRQIGSSQITRTYIRPCDNDFTALICR